MARKTSRICVPEDCRIVLDFSMKKVLDLIGQNNAI